MSSEEPVRVPKDVFEGLQAVRRYTGIDAPDIATVRMWQTREGNVPLRCGFTTTKEPMARDYSTVSRWRTRRTASLAAPLVWRSLG